MELALHRLVANLIQGQPGFKRSSIYSPLIQEMSKISDILKTTVAIEGHSRGLIIAETALSSMPVGNDRLLVDTVDRRLGSLNDDDQRPVLVR